MNAIIPTIQRFDSEVDGCKLIHLTALVPISERKILVPVATVTLSPRDWHFKQLFVEKEFRAHGIGTALIFAMIEIANKNAACSISCAVDPKNKEARAFYLARGFLTFYVFGDGDSLMVRVLDVGEVVSKERLKVHTDKHGHPKYEWS